MGGKEGGGISLPRKLCACAKCRLLRFFWRVGLVRTCELSTSSREHRPQVKEGKCTKVVGGATLRAKRGMSSSALFWRLRLVRTKLYSFEGKPKLRNEILFYYLTQGYKSAIIKKIYLRAS